MLCVRLLGAVAAERDGAPVAIASSKQRLLLAVLASARGTVSRSRLVDALWPDEPPPTAHSTLMAYVSRLRTALGTSAVISEGTGYRLAADGTDASRFEEVLRAPTATAADLERALALWRGDAFGDLADHPDLVADATRLEALREEAHVRLAAAHLEEGNAEQPVPVLKAVVASRPLREDAWALLVRALLASGRAAEAVATANEARRTLADVGLDPGPDLAEAQAEALQQRPGTRASSCRTLGPLRYARNGSTHLAFQTVGSGPVDLVLSSYGSISYESFWDEPHVRAFVLRLATSCRVVLYDTRGVGLSDPFDASRPPTLEEQSDDLQQVLDAAGGRPAVVVGIGDGGPTAITCAHRRPSTLRGLVLVNTFARLVQAEDYPAGLAADRFTAGVARSVDPDSTRTTADVLRNHAPSVAGDAAFRTWWERAGRRGASPSTAAALWHVRYGADVRHLLPAIAVPTLVLHRRGSRIVPLTHGRHLATHIPGARMVELDGRDQPPFTEHGARTAQLIAEFAAQVASVRD